MIVMKFGGTSVDGAERIAGVARTVRERAVDDPVVVTSAMRGVTDDLTRMLDVALSGDRESLDRETASLGERHQVAAESLAPSDQRLQQRVEAHLRELRVLLRGVRLVGVATPRSVDAVLGYGELLAQELLATALRGRDLESRVVDARSVLVTDDGFGAAQPDLARTTVRADAVVRPVIASGSVPVLGGYVGATEDGVPTTLGRGGSDLSAALLGLALRADAVEIWTDVSGLMTCDPRVEPAARVLPRASFLEAAELAAYGAKVLHPASIYPAVQGGIAVVVRNSFAPSEPGTHIAANGRASSAGDEVVAVGGRSGLSRMTIRHKAGVSTSELAATLAEATGRSGQTPLFTALGSTGASYVVDAGARASELAELFARLDRVENVETEEGLAAVAIVGEGVSGCERACARLFTRAAEVGFLGLLPASSSASLAVLVHERAKEPLMRALHADLVSGEPAERVGGRAS